MNRAFKAIVAGDGRPPARRDERSRFDALFVDARHFRADCRLLRTAIRRGWLAAEPQTVRDALAARFARALDERDAGGYGSASAHVRAVLAFGWTAIELARDEVKAARYTMAGEPTGLTTVYGP